MRPGERLLQRLASTMIAKPPSRPRRAAPTTPARSRPAGDSPGRARRAALLAAVLSALGAWTIAVPYLGHAIGFGVDVAVRVEIVDHVVPGTLVAVLGALLCALARRYRVIGELPALLAGGVCLLAGSWVLATHVALLAGAASGKATWGAAIWHASSSLPILAVSVWFLRGPVPPRQ